MNQLKVSIQQSIIVLTTRGWSRRRIARELGVDRATVGRQLRRAEAEANAATNPTLGSEGDPSSNAASNPTHGSESELPPKPATNPTLGSASGPASRCAPFAVQIAAGMEAGLTAQRIYQDLVCEHAFPWSYQSVKRYVRRQSVVH
ncbi:MAG: helix-turn-helix domain-containing protein, partial [Opitutae bacterium]|nr:helix-turn-helix domain-containing protein [Opitutae bacterium]